MTAEELLGLLRVLGQLGSRLGALEAENARLAETLATISGQLEKAKGGGGDGASDGP